MDFTVARELNSLYIILDIFFLIFLGYLLLMKKQKMTFLFGIAGDDNLLLS